MIDQVIFGDGFDPAGADLQALFIQVERVVDIVDSVFKMSSAFSLFEGT